MFVDYSPDRPRPEGDYWFAIRSADNALWPTAHTIVKDIPRITVRQKIWTQDELHYSYNAARPYQSDPGNMGTRVGSVILCSSLVVKNNVQQFGRQLIQYQISDILGDDLQYTTFGIFDVPVDMSAPEKTELINAMLTPNTRPKDEMSEQVTTETYLILSKTLQLGVAHPGQAED
jgi:hypothetical protein